MVGPPDSKNPPTASDAREHHGGDLTRNGPASAGDSDAVPDPRLEPEDDSLSAFVPEHVPLERRDSVPPGALTQAQRPPVDIVWPDDDADQWWWSPLRSLKASWEKKHPRRGAHDEPVTTEANRLGPAARTDEATMDAIRIVEKHLASLAALRDVCASIDRRLARVEDVSVQRDRATIDEALHDVCSQMYDRLVRVEAAVQRTEGFVAEKPWDLSSIAFKRLEHVEETLRLTQQSLADSTLREMCVNIDRQLVQARMALQRTEEAVADKTLHEICQNIDARLERTEGTLHRGEGIVAESLQQLSARMTARFGDVEETLRLTRQSLADSMVPETCLNIERQLTLARMALHRTEEAVADKTLHELCANIDARLERTEDSLHGSEGIVAESLRELSARMTTRFAEAEETIQRIERIVSRRTIEQTAAQAAVSTNGRSPRSNGGNRATDEPSCPAAVDGQPRCACLPWVARLAVPVLVLVAVFAIGALIKTSRGVAPEAVAPEKVVPLTTTERFRLLWCRQRTQGTDAPSSTALMANANRSTRESGVSAPQRRSPNRESAPTATGRRDTSGLCRSRPFRPGPRSRSMASQQA